MFFHIQRRLQVFLATACFLFSFDIAAQNHQLFERLSARQSGIKFKNTIKETASHNALTYENLYNGGGVAVGDINNDGLEDIYFVSNMEYNKLYLNMGNLKFRDITEKANVGGRSGWKTGVAMVDINGDNLLDIYVCYSGKQEKDERANQLFINKGNLVFEEKASEYGLDDTSYSTQAAFFDYDKDGDLDLFLLTTNVRIITEFEFSSARDEIDPNAGDKLFRNDGGKFIEVTQEAGIKANSLGFGLGVAISDINKDGWLDIYVSNDYIEPDYLYINNGDGTFTDRLTEYLQHISHFSMGSDINDFNNDGWPDIMTLDMLPEDNKRQKLLFGPENYEKYALQVMKGFYHQNMRNMLHLNNSDGSFSEIGQFSGVSNTDWSWAPLFADFDNDGWKDLFVTNGYFRDYTNRDFLKYKGDYYFQKLVAKEKVDTFELAMSMPSTPIHNYIFKNNGDLTFTDKSLEWGFEEPGFTNGAAYADLDNDGDLDLVVNNHNEQAAVYRNYSRERSNSRYLVLRLIGANANTSSIGASAYVYTQGKVQFQELFPMRGYQSTVTNKLFFGLGDTDLIDSIKIEWPTGGVTLLENVKADQTLDLLEDEKQDNGIDTSISEDAIFTKVNEVLKYEHIGHDYNDFKRQPLLLTMMSACGPEMSSGDVSGDGLEDIYVCGPAGGLGRLFIQQPEGNFLISGQFIFPEDNAKTDADVLLVDVDNDDDLDVYIASGGYHSYTPDDPNLQDRLFLNNGKGSFSKAEQSLPDMLSSKSCVKGMDFDHDGDVDLFVGGRIIPGQYPAPAPSYLLLNDGTGHFTDQTSTLIPDFKGGMVTSAAWIDANNDGWEDLIIVGEFMSIRLFINLEGKGFEEASSTYFDDPTSGLWSSIEVADFDNDGDTDFIAGNFGMNSQLRASQKQPITLYYGDFDKNGSIDPIMEYYVQGEPYPYVSRDELLNQVYEYRKKFTSYEAYSTAKIEDVLSKDDIASAEKLVVNELQTIYFENTGTKFLAHPLPASAQFAPVFAIEILDFDGDGNKDFVLAGNQTAISIRMGQIDANYGQLYKGDGKGNFEYIPQAKSGLTLKGDARSLKWMNIKGVNYLMVGINNKGVDIYKVK
ncbi:MAG: VCBS repeat-containing protein [Cyclobacteriaceae bacterium]